MSLHHVTGAYAAGLLHGIGYAASYFDRKRVPGDAGNDQLVVSRTQDVVLWQLISPPNSHRVGLFEVHGSGGAGA